MRIRWVRRNEIKVPDHWQRFEKRSSPLTGSPRLAADPVNAVLNYLSAILEPETRIALLSVGLEPGIGISHADQKSQDSMALDGMETARPTVGRLVLDLLDERAFPSPRPGTEAADSLNHSRIGWRRQRPSSPDQWHGQRSMSPACCRVARCRPRSPRRTAAKVGRPTRSSAPNPRNHGALSADSVCRTGGTGVDGRRDLCERAWQRGGWSR